MKLTEEIINSLDSKQYLANRELIKEFYKTKNSKEVKLIIPINFFPKKIKLVDKCPIFDQKVISKDNKVILIHKDIFPDKKKCINCCEFKLWKEFADNRFNFDGKDLDCLDCSKVRLIIEGYEKICLKLFKNVRSRIKTALKDNKKSVKTMELLGCSIEFLKGHLEQQFLSGMTWENHSKDGWHIDHIIECWRFDLSKPEEQRKCFHYSNLRPLWAIDNLSRKKK